MRINTPIATLVCALALTAGLVSAQTIFFVSPAGTPAGPGTLAAPFDTIQNAIDGTVGVVTINVLPGTYTENVVIDRDLRLEGLANRPLPVLVPFDPAEPTVLITDAIAPITRATQVKNFIFMGGDVGLEIRGNGFDAPNVVFGLGVSPEVTQNTFMDCETGIAVNVRNETALGGENLPWIRFNTITFAFPKPFGVGISIVTDVAGAPASAGPFVPLDCLVEANRISGLATGVFVEQVENDLDVTLRCDWINECQRGILIQAGAPDVVILHESIADGFAFFNQPMIGVDIQTAAAIVDIDSTILFVPDEAGSIGDELLNAVMAAVTFDFSTSRDFMDVAGGVGNVLLGPGGPGFVDLPNGDLHLAAGSLAIDAGNTALVLPGVMPAPPAYDNDAAPRLLDGDRTSVLAADIGASEFTQVALDVVAGPVPTPQATNATPRIDDITVAGPFTVVITSNFISPNMLPDVCALAIDFANTTNVLAPAPFDQLGNILVAPTTSLTIPMAPDAFGGLTGSVVLMAPVVAFSEFEIDFQAALLSTDVAVPGVGNMTRRARVEFNE